LSSGAGTHARLRENLPHAHLRRQRRAYTKRDPARAGSRVRRSALAYELLAEPGDVPLGSHVVLREGDRSMGVDDEGRAQHPFEGVAVDRLLAPAPPRAGDLRAVVGEEWERELLIGGELLKVRE